MFSSRRPNRSRRKPRPFRWTLPTWGPPAAFALGVVLLWGGLVALLAPDLFERLTATAPLTAAQQTARLAADTTRIESTIDDILRAEAAGTTTAWRTQHTEELNGVTWQSLRLEIQLPFKVDPATILEHIRQHHFSVKGTVTLDLFSLEALSPSLQITVDGYPTHLITLHPLLPKTIPPEELRLSQPQIALIIDDLGRSPTQLDTLFTLDEAFSVAILPFTPHALTVAEKAHQAGKEILVHMPMEALSRPDGTRLKTPRGQLTLQMRPEEIRTRLRKAIRAIPYAVGLNNHQGSAFTRNTPLMKALLGTLAEESMYFLDSKTISGSVGYSLGKGLGVPVTRRDVFIDMEQDPDKIRAALGRLQAIALKRGHALGIGHPHRQTMTVLFQWLQKVQAEGFELVPVSRLTEYPAQMP